jgi:uncharacterized lipoprotein YmbA
MPSFNTQTCIEQFDSIPDGWKHVEGTFNLLKPTGYVMHQQVQLSTIVRSAHTVFMCFVFI